MFIGAALLLPLGAAAQESGGGTPLYRIEVIQRSVHAVNYGYRGVPTKVAMKGTALAPEAKGEAKVHSRRGVVRSRRRSSGSRCPLGSVRSTSLTCCGPFRRRADRRTWANSSSTRATEAG